MHIFTFLGVYTYTQVVIFYTHRVKESYRMPIWEHFSNSSNRSEVPKMAYFHAILGDFEGFPHPLNY